MLRSLQRSARPLLPRRRSFGTVPRHRPAHPSAKPCRRDCRTCSSDVPSLWLAMSAGVSQRALEFLDYSSIPARSSPFVIALEPRLLPSTGVTRLHWYDEPLRHPTWPSLSLTSCWLCLTFSTPCWASRVATEPLCEHAVTLTPADCAGALFARFPTHLSLP